MIHPIVPPYLLARIAELDSDRFGVAVAAAQRALRHDAEFRAVRLTLSIDADGLVVEVAAGPDRAVSDAGHREDLPGTLVRSEGEEPVADRVVNEAYEGLGATFALFADVYGRNSIDGAGFPLDATVHYGLKYDNAFWDGQRMVFGDGDGQIFGRFTASTSVIGHELTHGVTEATAKLVYAGQSGALNESVSDVFGALVDQYSMSESVDTASWLIGAGIFTSAVRGAGLRSLKAPGTAYDDDVLGKDPQPAHFADYVVTTDDNGGVHLNSGIPNRAFYLVAAELGGNAWERAGQIWYDTLVGDLAETVDFAGFAGATRAAAAARYGEGSPEVSAVEAGWRGVGVMPRGR